MKTRIYALQLAAVGAALAALAACESADVAVYSTLPDAGPGLFSDINGHDTARPDGSGAGPPVCSGDLDCRTGSAPCMEATCVQGQCVIAPLPANALCDDGDPCTVNTTCRSGACVGTNVCAEPVEFLPFHAVPPFPLQPQTAL